MKLFNRCVSIEVLEEFYKTYEMDLSEYENDLLLFSSNEKMYSIKSFVAFFSDTVEVQTLFGAIKFTFINKILTTSMYSHIINRHVFYCENPNRILNKPKETLCNRLYRVIFTYELPPFHFDYMLPCPTFQSKDNLVLYMKQNKGYGNRKNSSIKRTLNSNQYTEMLLSSKKSQCSTVYKTSIKSTHKSSFLPKTKIVFIL